MRRKECEVTELREIVAIIEKCDVCRLGMVDGDRPYVVPMNFGFLHDGEALTLYFHCAGEGRKLDILSKNPHVCFEMDCGHELVKGNRACDYSYRYESVIGSGRAVLIEARDEKIHALNRIMGKYTSAEDYSFPHEQVDKTTVFMVRAEEYAAKRR